MQMQVSISTKSFLSSFTHNFFLRNDGHYLQKEVMLINGSIACPVTNSRGVKIMLIDKLRNFVIINAKFKNECLQQIEIYSKYNNVQVEVLIQEPMEIEKCVRQDVKHPRSFPFRWLFMNRV